MSPSRRGDIFCRVVDNYGDVGVAWRLARQLAHEHSFCVRMFVDDLASLARLVPAVGTGASIVEKIEICAWQQSESVDPAPLIIEAFGCELPNQYIESLRAQAASHCWLNLEYLTAESWIDSHHLLASLQPDSDLRKYFFFPGFTESSGGLIRERVVVEPAPHVTDASPPRVLLFGYPNRAATALVAAMNASGVAVDVPNGALADALSEAGARFHPREFVPQSAFDTLLTGYAVVFVRGEDSFLRAQWAARPFVWQIYPQADSAHEPKLAAFLGRYGEGLAEEHRDVVNSLWWAWNREDAAAVTVAWDAFWQHRQPIEAHALGWRNRLIEQADLATRLVTFFEKIVKI